VSKKLRNYIEYDLSKIKDTAAGFMTDEAQEQGPAGMTLEEWKEKQKLYQPRKHNS
jgi:hypothetical protein